MVFLAALSFLLASRLQDSIWMEGEDPSSINVKPTIAGWGHKEFLSGEKWLQISIEADHVERELADEGALISYNFTAQMAGKHEVWNRIGYEFVRSPFQWRIDGGDWLDISPERLTTDMEELQTWNEVAWLKLGETTLSAGSHTLQIRIPKVRDSKGKSQRILYASDALLITDSHFHPNGKNKPGLEYRTESDRAAENTKFFVKDQAGPGRQTVELGGLWEIARDDEELPGPVATPIEKLPNDPIWYGIAVPGDKNEERPELTMAHRIWYRTTIVVPQNQIGRSFSLTFPLNSLNTSVYVNGTLCGFNKNPFVNWSCDVTQAIRPGENQIWVGIRDAWYGYSSNPKDPMKLRKAFVLPLAVTGTGFQDLAYPVWHAFMSGILDTPKLTVGGPISVSDVFVKPSVSTKSLTADVSLLNTTQKAATGSVELAAVEVESGKVVKQLGDDPFSLPAGGSKTIQSTGPWANPTLWWPDRPHMYRLRTTVKVDGNPLEVSETPFGFREWSHRGKNLLLNGIVWHGWAELTQGKSKEEWLRNYRNTGQRFMRLSGPSQNGGVEWQGMSFESALDWFDEKGVIVRRCGPLDGEAIGYFAIENDPDLQSLYHTRIKKQLLDNWRDQMVAQVRGERNHPSIGMWSIENEWLYINCINLYGDLMDQFEREEKATFDAVAEVDPTRPAMSDGGGSGKGNLFPIHGDHYVFTNDPSRYPDLAYESFPEGGGRGRWVWDGNRPRYLGEEFFATGINPADYAWIEGEQAFGGKFDSEKGMALVQRMLTEGYRWGSDYTAWHLWIGNEGAAYGKYVPNAERAVFCRQQDWSFGSGQVVRRTLKIFNDSRSSDPIALTYALSVGGKTLQTKTQSYTVPPGQNVQVDAALAMPRVSSRESGEFILNLSSGAKDLFHDRKALAVLPRIGVAKKTESLGCYDPGHTFSKVWTTLGLRPLDVSSLSAIPASIKTLVVSPNSLTEPESTQSTLAAFAAEGRRVVVLNQRYPLHYQALPVPIESTKDSGDYGFPEIIDHPAFLGLSTTDFQGWQGGVYDNAYLKPESGARSLFQVGSRLSQSALLEVPVGQGLLLLSQVRSTANAPAERLVRNLIDYAGAYRAVYREVSVVASDDPDLMSAIGKIGLSSSRESSVMKAIGGGRAGIAIISATPSHLHELASHLSEVKAFTSRGGSIVFHGLTPAGLKDYNRIVGVDHVIRPFRREKTAIRIPRDPLASGLSSSNVVMYSGEKMFDFNDDRFVASDIFSYVVDFDDEAPFAELPTDYLYNTVNGFVSADGWKYIYSFDLDHTKPEYTMSFPTPRDFTEMTWIGNAFYHKVTKFSLTFDGKDTATFQVEPNDSPQALVFSPARHGQRIDLKILDWTHDETSNNVVGIDNISLKIKRNSEFYKSVHPLLNVGGLVRYEQGKGGIVLANLLFKEHEDVPENAGKKLAILVTLLRNLNAPFAAGPTVVAGAKNVAYQPIDISARANQYRGERGWFGDKDKSFGDLPSGRHVFAGVPFDIFDFPTSPVPNAIMLGGPGVPGNLPDAVHGIKVNATAGALFFLEAARIDQRRSNDEIRSGKRFVLAEYVIHYADGETATAPIYSEIDVEDYRQESPAALPGSQIAWVHAYPGSNLKAVAYVQQWNNPRPSVAIQSIDFRYGSDRRGVPSLLAITAGR